MIKSIIILCLLSFNVLAGEPNSNYTSEPEKSLFAQESGKNIFWGGNINFSVFNKYIYIGLFPMVGYNITEQFSSGFRVGYAYVSDGNMNPTLNSSNYGGGMFLRYKIIPQIFIKSEFIYFSFERAINILPTGYSTKRYDVPMILLGAGYNHKVNKNVSVFAEVSFDLLQDSNSPFEPWDPFFSIGVGYGL